MIVLQESRCLISAYSHVLYYPALLQFPERKQKQLFQGSMLLITAALRNLIKEFRGSLDDFCTFEMPQIQDSNVEDSKKKNNELIIIYASDSAETN